MTQELLITTRGRSWAMVLDGDTTISVDGVEVRKPAEIVAIKTMRTRTRFKIPGINEIFIKLNGGIAALAGVYMNERTLEVGNAYFSEKGEVV